MKRGFPPRPAVWAVVVALCVTAPLVAQTSEPSSPPNGAGDSSSWEGQGEGKRTVGDLIEGSSPDPEATDTRRGAGTITMKSYFEVLGWLVVVLILAVVTLRVLKKVQVGTGNARAADAMQVVARTALTAKHQLVAVRVAQRLLIVGVSPDGLRILSELTDPREVVPLTGSSFQRELDGQDYEPTSKEDAELESDVEPHRRELSNLKDLIGSWRRGAPSRAEARQ